ncbi:MAG: hypothetical protein R6U86_00900 [Bacteroidales bacterium]
MLRLIATFILIYLLFRVVTTWLLPMLVRWYINRFKRRYHRENQRPKPEQAAAKTDKLGEYVDYEEIREKDNHQEKHPGSKPQE